MNGPGPDVVAVWEQRWEDAQRAPAGERATVIEGLLEFAAEQPEAAGDAFWMPEVWEELGRAYEELGRVDDALAAVQKAIDVGLAGSPDPRSVLAEIHYRAGRREVADGIWRMLRERDPGDVWLYNVVGMEKADGGEHGQAAEWLAAGLELAIAGGDPERIVGQLSAARAASLTVLGRAGDDLQARAARFLADPPPRPAPAVWARAPAAGPAAGPAARGAGRVLPWADLAGTTAFTAGLPVVPTAPAGTAAAGPSGAGSRALLGLAWFPAREYRAALDRWPELAEAGGPAAGADGGRAGHRAYSAAIEAHLCGLRDADVADATRAEAGVPGVQLTVVPLTVAALLRWAAEHGQDPGSPDTRAGLAAEGARTGRGRAWPPGPRQDCWCGSGRRYKSCCGATR